MKNMAKNIKFPGYNWFNRWFTCHWWCNIWLLTTLAIILWKYLQIYAKFLRKTLLFTFVDIVEFLGAITRPRSSVFKSTKTGEADWSIVHVDTLVLTNQRRPLIFRVHVDNLLTNEGTPIILVRKQLRSVVFRHQNWWQWDQFWLRNSFCGVFVLVITKKVFFL